MYTTVLRLSASPSVDSSELNNLPGSSSSWGSFEEARRAAEGQFLLAVPASNPSPFAHISISANDGEMFSTSLEVQDPASRSALASQLDEVAKTAPKDMEFYSLKCYKTFELFDSPASVSKRAQELVQDAYVDVVIRKVPVTIPQDQATGKKALEAAKNILGINGTPAAGTDAFDEATPKSETQETSPKAAASKDKAKDAPAEKAPKSKAPQPKVITDDKDDDPFAQ